MANRLVGFDMTAGTILGQAVLVDAQSWNLTTTIKTADGKGVGEVDDWDVITGRRNEFTVDLQVPATGTLPFMGSVNAASPATARGTFTLDVGPQTFSGTCTITSVGNQFEREGIQMQNISAVVNGIMTVA